MGEIYLPSTILVIIFDALIIHGLIYGFDSIRLFAMLVDGTRYNFWYRQSCVIVSHVKIRKLHYSIINASIYDTQRVKM